jgi:AMMECR1 domain-containing protein
MSLEELDRIEQELKILNAAEARADACDAIQRYNKEIERHRATIAAARQAGVVRPDVEVELRAAAVLYADERERLVRRFGLRS